MKSIINRSYDITVYPYDDDEYCSFTLNIREINEKIIRILLTCYPEFDQPMYLGICEDGIWFVDPENYRGLTMKAPVTSDDAYPYFEEIDDYDEEMCTVLAETVSLLYHDILSRSVSAEVPMINAPAMF